MHHLPGMCLQAFMDAVDLGKPVDLTEHFRMEPDRREAIAEGDTITAPRGRMPRGWSSLPCMAALGAAPMSDEEKWAELRWSGADPSVVYCGAPATVWVGFNACDEHGAEYLAQQLERRISQYRDVLLAERFLAQRGEAA